MASRAGPRPTTSDGTDFQHRERIAGHYQTSIANKSRLRYVIYLHLLLALLMLLRLSPSLLTLASLAVPPALTSLGLPAPWLWEYAWLASVVPALFGLLALNRNRALMLRQFALGTVALGLAPVLYGMAELGWELWEYWETRETDKRINGFPAVVLWSMFLFIALQLHGLGLLLAWTLWKAWIPRKKAS